MTTIVKPMLTDICLNLAHRLRNPHWIQKISLQRDNFLPFINAYPWDITTLSHGYPGYIVLFSELDAFFPNQGWDRVAHQYILDLIQEVEKIGVHNSSLFSGLTGICFSIHLASKGGSRYQSILSQLNAIFIQKIETDYLLPIEATLATNKPLSPFHYDVIAGISGVLSYILEVIQHDSMRILAQSLVKALIALSKPVLHQNTSLPGWYVPQDYLIREEHQKLYVDGCFDTGLAHGIAGCIAVLSKAYLKGIVIEHQRDAIQKMVSWLQENHIQHDTLSTIWPARFGFNPKHKNNLEVISDFYRDGWCYGAPGIASALLLASKALENESLKQEMIQVMIGVCERFYKKRNLECVTFCHGLAGLFSMIHSFYLETNMTIFSETSQQIINLIIERYDPNLPFGFKCHATLPNSRETLLIDNAGLLDGVSGTLLSLLFALSNQPREWTHLFLIK